MSVASELMDKIDRDFLDLRKEYLLFFSNVSNNQPFDLRDAVEENTSRLRNMSNLRTSDQFRANNLIAKIQSHIQLWDRQLDRKYAGTPMSGARPKRGGRSLPPSMVKDNPPENKKVVISSGADEREKVVQLYDEYMRLNLLLGNRSMTNFANFQGFINAQTEKIQKTGGGKTVQYEVLLKDQKVVIKSKKLE